MRNILTILIIICTITVTIYPQNWGQRRGGTVKGKVIDGVSKEPIVYGNIILYSAKDSSQVSGAATTNEGTFAE